MATCLSWCLSCRSCRLMQHVSMNPCAACGKGQCARPPVVHCSAWLLQTYRAMAHFEVSCLVGADSSSSAGSCGTHHADSGGSTAFAAPDARAGPPSAGRANTPKPSPSAHRDGPSSSGASRARSRRRAAKQGSGDRELGARLGAAPAAGAADAGGGFFAAVVAAAEAEARRARTAHTDGPIPARSSTPALHACAYATRML